MDAEATCCMPGRSTPAAEPGGSAKPGTTAVHRIEQCHVPAGVFAMGDHHSDGRGGDGERPVHAVRLDAFDIDATTVTNADFATFVQNSGYRTQAEHFGSSAVFHLTVAAADQDIIGRSPRAPWWLQVRGANWQHPEGPRSDLDGRSDHPVVHISWHDSQAYCAWAGRRLPTEAEWERASRGGLTGARYPWGDDLLTPDGDWRTNIWQGTFPTENTIDDGWLTTAPVRTYQPNGFGLWQTVGNVWEWCQDGYNPRAYATRSAHTPTRNPLEPATGDIHVLRGGSFLCHDSYCNRYRNAARSGNTADSSMANAGFRTAATPEINQ